MKSHTTHLTLNVPARMDFVNITPDVKKALAEIVALDVVTAPPVLIRIEDEDGEE